MAELSSPDIKPGERYPWTYPEREGQMGTFGPASMATYAGVIATALVFIVAAINAAIAFMIGRTWFESFIFAVIAFPVSLLVASLPGTYLSFADTRPDGDWLAKWAKRWIVILVLAFWAGSTIVLFDHNKGGLIAATFREVFPVKHLSVKQGWQNEPCSSYAPLINAGAAAHKAASHLDRVKYWCLTGHNEDACADLPGAQRAYDDEKKSLECAYRSKTHNKQDIFVDAPLHWDARAVWDLLVTAIFMALVQIALPILPVVISFGRKGFMLERFDGTQAPAATIRVNGDIPISQVPPAGMLDTFAIWSGERLVPDSSARGLKFSQLYEDYDLFCLQNGYKDMRVPQPAFQDRLKLYIKSIQGAKRHSGGSVYDGLRIAS